jgi:hypothetical protein
MIIKVNKIIKIQAINQKCILNNKVKNSHLKLI